MLQVGRLDDPVLGQGPLGDRGLLQGAVAVRDELAIDAVAPGRQHEPAFGVIQKEDSPLHRGLADDPLANPVVEIVELALLVELEEELPHDVEGL